MYIQEPYFGRSVPSHEAFDIRWETVEKRKGQRVAVGISVNTRTKLIMEVWTDITYHPWIILKHAS